jgi:hypothetical protein
MASLVGQVLAVLAAAYLARALLAGMGLDLGLSRAAALAVLAVLAILSIGQFREDWQRLDVQRARFAHLPAATARADCVNVGLDPSPLGKVAERIPEREHYLLRVRRRLPNNGELCMRFVLFPRLQVSRPEEARYIVFWQHTPRPALDALRRRGATVELLQPGYAIARLP